MKKIVGFIFIAIFAITLASCGSKEYKVDGKFTAFEVSLNRDTPQITWVEVTVEKGKVTNYFIDARQSKVTTNEESGAKTLAWNEKTKKELKFDYGMTGASEIGKEWFEQAAVIEKFFLEKGPDALKLDKDGYIEDLTGATVKGGDYQKLAKKALENAKNGIFTDFIVDLNSGKAQVTWVDVKVEKNKVVSYTIDARQSKLTDGKTVWNEKTKKELKFDYGMTGASEIGKEWFEQAAVIEKLFLEKGPDALKLNEKGYIEDLTGATVKGAAYKQLAKNALSKIASKLK
ncbi:hypothetical protein [Haploplasma modicum]|uniref:hypothetical protein n=1 Tax=Haploplasma modicum TaxID=2150 RepID=UPI00214BB1DB|nr:hypothetical protein [Haploplasma modicum]MCR1808828.1 hypothetical protein [Haploplasma modicum]